jgi:TRAP-type C4-dicarboxylate transport system permease small subunit
MRGRDHARQRAYVVVIVCLALLALLTFIQVAHVHSVNTDTDHCPLCIVLHTAAPVAMAAAIMVLVQLEVLAPVAEARSIRATGQRQLFIRPPPSA